MYLQVTFPILFLFPHTLVRMRQRIFMTPPVIEEHAQKESRRRNREQGARPPWAYLLRSKILSNYWYGATYILPQIANITQHRQYDS